MNYFKLQGIRLHFQRNTIQKRFFCQKVFLYNTYQYLLQYFVLCVSEKPKNEHFFSNIFIYMYPTITNVIIHQRRLLIFILLQCTGMGDSTIMRLLSSFLGIFTPCINKSDQNCTKGVLRDNLKIFSSYFKFYIDKLYQVLTDTKKPTKQDWSTCVNKQISRKFIS